MTNNADDTAAAIVIGSFVSDCIIACTRDFEVRNIVDDRHVNISSE